MQYVGAFLLLAICSWSARAAVPRPAWDCVDDKIVAKYHGESCFSEEDCFGRSMKCQDGKCACKEDYLPAERFVGENAKQTVCVLAPSLFSECSTICQKPYVCKEHSELKKKLCHCESPFKLTDRTCHLECTETEEYDSSKFRCIAKCTANEIKHNDTCVKLGNINDACLVDQQCLPAYSSCKEGKCACADGFLVKDGNCVIDEIRCPNNQVIKSPTPCQLKKAPTESRSYGYNLIDSCPPENFCYIIGGVYKSENSEGYCCPKIETKCPAGSPHATARCRSNPLFKDGDKECPWSSHYCQSANSGGNEACCPRRCDSGTVHINGKCYPTARLNSPCLQDAQCSDSRTKCVNGFCKCSDGATEVKQPTYSYCTIACKPEEIQRDNLCHTPLSLGDSCTNQTWRCPINAICNKFNVCSCACPRFTLSKDVCAPVPQCPAPKRHYPMQLRSGAMGVAMEASKYYQPISDEKRRELLQNVTFCAIPGKEPPKVEKVEKCPDGQYCANYISNLGMCCRIPEYSCPSGKKPVSEKCSTRDPLSCGLKKYCHDYLYTADPNSTDGKFCCDVEQPDDYTR